MFSATKLCWRQHDLSANQSFESLNVKEESFKKSVKILKRTVSIITFRLILSINYPYNQFWFFFFRSVLIFWPIHTYPPLNYSLKIYTYLRVCFMFVIFNKTYSMSCVVWNNGPWPLMGQLLTEYSIKEIVYLRFLIFFLFFFFIYPFNYFPDFSTSFWLRVWNWT